MNKVLLAIFATMTVLLAACGGTNEPETFEPAYYGSDRTEQCYFVEDPSETVTLKEDGLCEQDWNPAPWPEDDFAGFYPFFFFAGGGSHHYHDRHVTPARKGGYTAKIDTFEKNPAFKQKYLALSPKAKYVSSTGKIVTGDKVKVSQFGGARVRSGTGSRPQKCSLGVLNVELMAFAAPPKAPGGGGGSRGGSSGGGSRSGGGAKSGSGPKSGTTAKC